MGGRGRADDEKIFCGMAQPRASPEQGSYVRCSSCCVRNYSGTELPRPLRRRKVMSWAPGPRRTHSRLEACNLGPVLSDSDPSCRTCLVGPVLPKSVVPSDQGRNEDGQCQAELMPGVAHGSRPSPPAKPNDVCRTASCVSFGSMTTSGQL